jgi:hypothetical protein
VIRYLDVPRRRTPCHPPDHDENHRQSATQNGTLGKARYLRGRLADWICLAIESAFARARMRPTMSDAKLILQPAIDSWNSSDHTLGQRFTQTT